MRVFAVLLLSLLQAVAAQNIGTMEGRELRQNREPTISGGTMTFSRLNKEDGSKVELRASKSGDFGAGCGLCNEDDINNIDCIAWDLTVEYKDYDVVNLFCGCGRRINPTNQCRVFANDEAVTLVEEYAQAKCDVHLACSLVAFDDEPNEHDCDETCLFLGFLGCLAECNTNCYFGVACVPLVPVRD